MTPHDFRASSWVQRLGQSLATLKNIEDNHRVELTAVSSVAGTAHEMRLLSFFDSPSSRRLSLYLKAAHHKDPSYYRSHYEELSSPLNAVKSLLREHPVLNRALGPSDDDEFRIGIMTVGTIKSLNHVIAGLMSCAMESNYDDVASRLHELLSAEKERPLKGYHISIFRGSRLDRELEFADGMSIAPFDSIKHFIPPFSLRSAVWDIDQFTRRGPLAAIRKPFHWEPVIVGVDDELKWTPPFDKEFPNNANAVVDLLAIAHAAPLMNMMCFQCCVDPQVWALLGSPGTDGSASWPQGLPINADLGDTPLSMEHFSEAKDIFCRLKDSNNDQTRYESVISRLAGSLLRRGKLEAADKILDVAIALELMYELDSPELKYKLATRAAWFLEKNSQGRVETFNKVRKFYDTRSSVVHNDRGKSNKKSEQYAQNIAEQFNQGFDLARRTLFKLLRDGRPSDWNQLVLSGGSQ